jgi:hypothetical protein
MKSDVAACTICNFVFANVTNRRPGLQGKNGRFSRYFNNIRHMKKKWGIFTLSEQKKLDFPGFPPRRISRGLSGRETFPAVANRSTPTPFLPTPRLFG